MGVEIRPFRSACNLNCTYCYESPQRDLRQKSAYDLNKIISAVKNELFHFTLFGGEPLLMPIQDIEKLFKIGFERHGYSSIQTNGSLITTRHIEVFKKFNVHVGISIDGPEDLNSLRIGQNIKRTSELTQKTLMNISRLCNEWKAPSLIVTLSKTNATEEKLPVLIKWIKECAAKGVNSFRFHVLELNNNPLTKLQILTDEENLNAILEFEKVEKQYSGLRLDMSTEPEALLKGNDSLASCTWQACDPYTTPAVRGITGEGEVSRCGRTDKDGKDGLKADTPGYERYIALYQTEQSEGGCKGCKYFLFCKGHCPGTAIEADWRNRTRDCSLYKDIFSLYEDRLIEQGQEPLTLHPNLKSLELQMFQNWLIGINGPISSLAMNKKVSLDLTNFIMPDFIRLIWHSQKQKDIWSIRIKKIKEVLPFIVAQAIIDGVMPSAYINIAPYLVSKLKKITKNLKLDLDSSSNKYRVRGSQISPRFLIAIDSNLELIRTSALTEKQDKTQSRFENTSLSVLGLGLSFDTFYHQNFNDYLKTPSLTKKYGEEINWLKELLDMAVANSDINGITVSKTSLFDLVYNTEQGKINHFQSNTTANNV